MTSRATLQQFSEGTFDLLVVGGGITGSGVAREASLRGLRVALVEARDFASGTSSRSTKLIHGGLRYLKNMDFRLVREAVQERMRMLEMAPHLVKVVPFLFPVYQGDPDSLLMLRAGLTLYDWFAGKGNPIPHRIHGPGALLGREPLIGAHRLGGGAEYCDAATNDARLTLEVVQSAISLGATVANYMAVESILRDTNQQIYGARLVDKLTGETGEVRAKRVIAAGGPWADSIRQMEQPGAPELLRLTKGVHLTLPAKKLPIKSAVVMRGPDGRMMFAVPAGEFTYVGTTDTDYTGDPQKVGVDASDVAYIIEATNRTFPQAHVTGDDVNSAWAGLRPLVRPQAGKSPSSTSRDYTLNRGPSGLYSVAGGKLTAFRHMAAHIVDEVFPKTKGDHLQASMAPLPGAVLPMLTPDQLGALAAQTRTPIAHVTRLAEQYGGNFKRVLAELPDGGDPARSTEHQWLSAQLRHAVKHEMAVRLEDVLARRTETFLFTAGNGREYVESLAQEMGEMLGWSTERVAAESKSCLAQIDAMFAWRQEQEPSRSVS
ncbi:MAG TPA: glycerol-3-phosphate dehydrogenase/oxidase [Symbiobacteriaceae bacterium]|nr:glycerol-3-phosphate dehydrogenase/oxidase [Symbiobacteriaceae bacterium]